MQKQFSQMDQVPTLSRPSFFIQTNNLCSSRWQDISVQSYKISWIIAPKRAFCSVYQEQEAAFTRRTQDVLRKWVFLQMKLYYECQHLFILKKKRACMAIRSKVIRNDRFTSKQVFESGVWYRNFITAFQNMLHNTNFVYFSSQTIYCSCAILIR